MSGQRREAVEQTRQALLSDVQRLAQRAIFGTASSTFRCGAAETRGVGVITGGRSTGPMST